MAEDDGKQLIATETGQNSYVSYSYSYVLCGNFSLLAWRAGCMVRSMPKHKIQMQL